MDPPKKKAAAPKKSVSTAGAGDPHSIAPKPAAKSDSTSAPKKKNNYIDISLTK